MIPHSKQRAAFQASPHSVFTVPLVLVGRGRSLGASCIRRFMDENMVGIEALSIKRVRP